MGKPTRIKTANDNLPSPQPLYAGGSHAHAPQNKFGPDHQASPGIKNVIPDSLRAQSQKGDTSLTKSLTITLALWAAAIIFALGSFLLGAGAGMKSLASVGLLWIGLWSSYISADHRLWRVSEVCVMSALAGLTGAITTAANYFGLGLTLAEGLMLVSILSLLIGLLLKSRICVLTSILATLGWGVHILIGSGQISGVMAFLPLILAGQLYAATRIGSGLAVLLSISTAYYWGLSLALSFWSADDLPLTFAASALFIIGAAHYRCGKASEDTQLIGSGLHIHIGWVAAIIGAASFQYLWLNPDSLKGSTATLSESGLTFWKGVVVASLIIIFGSAIIRYKYSQISFAGIFLLTAACALLPMMLWFPAWIQSLMSTTLDVEPMTTTGVMIGAAITAMCTGMILNGARRQSFPMIIMGVIALFAQGYLLLKPELLTLDNTVIFAATFLAALALGGVIAGSSLAHQAPAPRLKHR